MADPRILRISEKRQLKLVTSAAQFTLVLCLFLLQLNRTMISMFLCMYVCL